MKTAIVVVVSYILTVAVLGYGLMYMRKSNKALTQTVAAQEAAIKSKDETIRIYKARAQSLQEQVSAEMGEVEVARGGIYAKRDKLMQAMNPKTVSFYEKIRKWAGNTAVSLVRKQACYGCFMQINDKTYSAVIKGEDIVTCPHCGRILYKEAAN